MPVLDEDETLGWISEVFVDEDGFEYSYSGPEVSKTEKISKEELIDNCYNKSFSEEQTEDCLVTFEEVEPDEWNNRKIDKDSYAYMESSKETSFDGFIRLKRLKMMNSVDSLLLYTWENQELFDSGLLSEKEVRKQFSDEIVQTRKDRFLVVKDELENIAGVTVEDHLTGLDWVKIRLGLESINDLEKLSYVDRIMVPDPDTKIEMLSQESPYVLEHMQMHDPYYVSDTGVWSGYYEGQATPKNTTSFDRLTVAVFDEQGFNADHISFNSTSSGSSRIEASFVCDTSFCIPYQNPLDVHADQGLNSTYCGIDERACDHGTQILSSILGDLRDEQDPNFPSTNNLEQRKHSGGSPEADAVLFNDEGASSLTRAISNASSLNVDLISISQGWEDMCEGDSDFSNEVNDAFLDGTLSSIAAGNSYHNGTCTANAGADATSALTVGALGNGNENSVSDFTTTDVWIGSSQGWHNYTGSRYRTILDIVAPGEICGFASPTDNDGYGSYFIDSHGVLKHERCWGPATSHAQPRAASALLNLITHRLNNGDETIRLPGIQKAVMLGMDSRHFSTWFRSSNGYHSYWGAGRLKMRRLDSIGLDTPYGYSFGYKCIPNSANVISTINLGNPLPSDVESIKATAWWYTDDFSTANDIDVYLEEYVNGQWQTLMSDTGSDLKKRVYWYGVGGKTLRLKFTGTDVNGDHEDPGICSSSQARVYFFFVYEDSDRDDADGYPESGIDVL